MILEREIKRKIRLKDRMIYSLMSLNDRINYEKCVAHFVIVWISESVLTKAKMSRISLDDIILWGSHYICSLLLTEISLCGM